MIEEKDLPSTDGVWRRAKDAWYSMLNGQTHNSLGPALIYDDGEKHWFINGKRHYEDGPAVVVTYNSSKEWWIDGKLHRLDGPAFESDKVKEWWINGTQVLEQDFSSAVISFLLGIDMKTAEIIECELKND